MSLDLHARDASRFSHKGTKKETKVQRGFNFAPLCLPLCLCVKLLMWSISIYTGNSPFTLEPFQAGPVLTRDHVTDIPAAFVADPFTLEPFQAGPVLTRDHV